MSKVFGAGLAAALACGALADSPQVLAADGKDRPLNVVFVNPGKTAEVYWHMVCSTMMAAGSQLGMSLETLQAERNSLQEAGTRDCRGQQHAKARCSRAGEPRVRGIAGHEAGRNRGAQNPSAVEYLRRTGRRQHRFAAAEFQDGDRRMWIGDITADLDMAGHGWRMRCSTLRRRMAEHGWQDPYPGDRRRRYDAGRDRAQRRADACRGRSVRCHDRPQGVCQLECRRNRACHRKLSRLCGAQEYPGAAGSGAETIRRRLAPSRRWAPPICSPARTCRSSASTGPSMR
jgi:hypothetical protein